MKKKHKGGNLSPSRIGNPPATMPSASISTHTDLKTQSISEIAAIIQEDWQNVYFGAEPYLEAMHYINNINDRYGFDDGRTLVAYFLTNSSRWKGPVAKQVKAELNRRLKTSRNQMAKGGRVKTEKFINQKFAKWVLDAKKAKKNIAIDYYDNDQLSAWTISPSGKLMQERTFDYNKESEVMHDIDEARKLIFVDQAFRCGGRPKKMAMGGEITFSDEIIEKAKALSDYQFNRWLQEEYPKLFKQLHFILLEEKSIKSKRVYFLKMAMVKPELAAQIQPGDKVTILLPSGLLGTGIATIKTREHQNTWTLNMGGAHGTPRVADETNIVAIRKSSNNNEHIPAAQMADGGQITTYRQILESIPHRPGINQQAIEFSRQMLEDAGVDEIPIDNPDVQLLLQKLESFPVDTPSGNTDEAINIKVEPVDIPPAEPLPPANRKILETRLRVIKKMIAKNPENKTLSLRVKIIQKMISKLK